MRRFIENKVMIGESKMGSNSSSSRISSKGKFQSPDKLYFFICILVVVAIFYRTCSILSRRQRPKFEKSEIGNSPPIRRYSKMEYIRLKCAQCVELVEHSVFLAHAKIDRVSSHTLLVDMPSSRSLVPHTCNYFQSESQTGFHIDAQHSTDNVGKRVIFIINSLDFFFLPNLVSKFTHKMVQ